jgi:hypothetical protein
VVAAALGHRDKSAEHFDAALAATQRSGADLLVARTYLDRGRALDDIDATRNARAWYEALGITKRVAEIDGQGI